MCEKQPADVPASVLQVASEAAVEAPLTPPVALHASPTHHLRRVASAHARYLRNDSGPLGRDQLRALARERQVLVREAAQLKIRVHAYQHSYQPDSRTLARLAAQQQLLVNQLKSLDQDLAALLQAEPELARKLGHLTSIPGVGLTTAIVVVAETNGFILVKNER